MSKSIMYSLYDEGREQFLAPFLCVSETEAKRFIIQQCKSSPDCLFNMFPKYYTLHKIGIFDDKKAVISENRATKKISSIKDLLDESDEVKDGKK